MSLVSICCFLTGRRETNETMLGEVDEYGYNDRFVKGKFDELLKEDFGGTDNAKVVLCRIATSQSAMVGTGGMLVACQRASAADSEGLFVFSVAKGSAVEKAGLRVGDQLLEINKKSLYGRNNAHASSVFLKESRSARVSLVVMRCKDWKSRMNNVPLQFDADDNIVPFIAISVNEAEAARDQDGAEAAGTAGAAGSASKDANAANGKAVVRLPKLNLEWSGMKRKAPKDCTNAVASMNVPGIEVKSFELTDTAFGPGEERVI